VRVILTPEAETDLAAAYDWYEGQRPELGRELIVAVDDQLRRIEDNPELYPIRRFGVRRALIRRFPYAIFYLQDGEALVVLAIDHQARHPDHWHERLERHGRTGLSTPGTRPR
jgi:plasmid stabilization system protein ParE